MKPKRIIVFGHSGFIGRRLVDCLRRTAVSAEIVGMSFDDVDLTDYERSQSLLNLFDLNTLVVMGAAIKRQDGDTVDIFLRNLNMTVTLAKLLAQTPIFRLVYLSSAAVYGEDIGNSRINEATLIQPRSFYGLYKANSEWILSRVVASGGANSILILRPATVYGPGENPNAYGPTGFLRATIEGKPIMLWGDGSEKRELIFVQDVAEIIARLSLTPAAGIVNLVAGKSYTFNDVIDGVATILGRRPEVTSRPRTKDKVDNSFDGSRLAGLLPDFAFTPLLEGIRTTHNEIGSRTLL